MQPISIVKIRKLLNLFRLNSLKEQKYYCFRFSNNKLLVKVTIPHSMDRIGENVFDGCSSLGEVVWNADSVNNDRCRFSKSLYKISIGDKVRVIPNYFLYQCTGLAEIKLPESVESIGESAFGECDGIKQFVIPNSVKTIGRIAISYCDNLERLLLVKDYKV